MLISFDLFIDPEEGGDMFLRKGLHGATSQKTKLFLESVLFP
jgi:hypothetical protein